MQQQDGPAEDGRENEWNLQYQRWLLGKLEHLIGKYLLAFSSDDNRLLTQKIQISVLYDSSRLHTFYSAADNIPRA